MPSKKKILYEFRRVALPGSSLLSSSVVGEVRNVVRLILTLLPLPHLEEEPLNVGGVGADAEERAVGAGLPHFGAGASQTGKRNENAQ